MSDPDGPLVTQAWVCNEKGQDLKLQDITLPPLKPAMVEIDMKCCGLCHTDIHMRDNDWGISNYPMVAGHEGIGIVAKVGASVRNIKVGDTVGVAWIRDSCASCDGCKAGRENLCQAGYQGTYLGPAAGCWGKDPHHEHGGCFSKIMRVQENFVVKIPEKLPFTVAAPLMCAGATVFEPICDYVEPGKQVAVASIGGLGSLAIKLAASFGGTVTALSRSETKRDKCLGLGAVDFKACLGDAEKMKELAGKFDVILDTSPVNADVGPYMDMLKFDGVYCRVGIPMAANQTFSYQYIPLIFTQKKIAGSIVTGTARMQQMFELAGAHPDKYGHDQKDWNVKVVPFDSINETMKNLSEGKNTENYRYVLEW